MPGQWAFTMEGHMAETTKIGIICDMHLPDDKTSPQYAFLLMAAERMKKDGVDTVICLGDITAFGELGGWELYQEALQDFTHYEVAGNSDVRDGSTREILTGKLKPAAFSAGTRSVIGLNTPDAQITESDRERLRDVKPGDIIFLHHYIRTLTEESGAWLTRLAEEVPVTILHGHGHRYFDYYINESHILGMRGLDPDKSIGNFPSINYLKISEEAVTLEEVMIDLPQSYLEAVSQYFGLSCVDNARDVAYATEQGIKYVELRCNGRDWTPDMELLPLLKAWREKTDGYLSIHMPNLRYKDGEVHGMEQWKEALQYALVTNADSLTIHPPRVQVRDMAVGSEAWNTLLELYLEVVRTVPAATRVGIENLHKEAGEKLDEARGFGYLPSEVSAWIDAINEQVAGNQDGTPRVGHILDVGHARNNGGFAQRFPISRWYGIMGGKAVAYHIHQVVSGPNGAANHSPLECWFGPMINYTSFFYGWHHGLLNHVPVFLEVKGSENYAKSMKGFREMLEYYQHS